MPNSNMPPKGPAPTGMFYQPPQPYYYQNQQMPPNQNPQNNNLPPYPYAAPPPNNYPPGPPQQPYNYAPNYARANSNTRYPPYMPNFKSEHMVKFRRNRGGDGSVSNFGEREQMPRYGSDFNIMNPGIRGGANKRGGPPQPGYMYRSSRSMIHDYYQRGGRFEAEEIIESEEEESEESLNKAEL